MARPDVKEKILTTASTLFYRDGIHATGIDTVVEASGIARMTLYHHFASKDKLIEAVLERRADEVEAWLQATYEQKDLGARERLLLLFDAMKKRFKSGQFYGCPFVNATAEFSGHDHFVRHMSENYNRRFVYWIEKFTFELPVEDPETLARQRCLLIQGSIVVAQVSGSEEWARDARIMAAGLIDKHIVKG